MGFSITLGYHRLYPYNIREGLFQAHIGWLLFKLKPPPPFDNVIDLQKDRLVMWQHHYIHWIGATVAFVLPAGIGYAWAVRLTAALGAFLIAGVARVVVVQHCTFCINSLCHYIGKQTYSSRCSARGSWLMSLVTFGEGYHNYHHEFPYDYRNGVKPWQFDPTKWIIWTLSKVGLATKLRRVPADRILRAELAASCDRNNADILGGRWPDERSYPRIGRMEYKRFAEKSSALCPEAKISILQAYPLRKRTDWGEKRLRVR